MGTIGCQKWQDEINEDIDKTKNNIPPEIEVTSTNELTINPTDELIPIERRVVSLDFLFVIS